METKYYSIKEAAEELKVSRTYIYYLRDTGQIKVEKIGSQYVITQEEIERYKNSHFDNPSPENTTTKEEK